MKKRFSEGQIIGILKEQEAEAGAAAAIHVERPRLWLSDRH